MKDTKEWGEYFPTKSSPFAYNESVAQEYFPISKNESISLGYKWKEYKLLPNSNKIEMNYEDYSNAALNSIFKCKVSNQLYKLQKHELKFYEKFSIPLPRTHHDIRHFNRMSKRNPRVLINSECVQCNKNIMTTYKDIKVYCEECFNSIR